MQSRSHFDHCCKYLEKPADSDDDFKIIELNDGFVKQSYLKFITIGTKKKTTNAIKRKSDCFWTTKSMNIDNQKLIKNFWYSIESANFVLGDQQ